MVTRTWAMADTLAECPLGWQNFIQDLEERIPDPQSRGFSIGTLNSELELYRARYYESGLNSFVDFYSEKCYTLFILKYGGKQ